MRPIACFNRGRDLNRKCSEARRIDRGLGARKFGIPVFHHIVSELPHTGRVVVGRRNRFDHALHENVRFPGRAEFAGQPFQFTFDAICLLATQQLGK